MDVFLPIAEVSVNIIAILLLSGVVGILSGLFGVGGGFLMTPFLIFLGVPPAYAVANEANNILATSVSGSTTHYLKNTLDYKMGLMIVIGGTIGTALGIYIFTYFKGIGKIDTVISLAYMYILAIIGTLMLVESLGEIDRAKRNLIVKKKLHVHYWIHGLPLRMRFPKSKLYESIFTPIIIGLVVGFIAAIMGIGGAFILVPAMIYIIKMPTKLVPGTSLFVTIFITGFVVIAHAVQFKSIDLVLVSFLLFGSIIGLHVGLKISEKLNALPVITTAADVNKTIVVDLVGRQFGWKIDDETTVTKISAHMVNSEPIGVFQQTGNTKWYKELPKNVTIYDNLEELKKSNSKAHLIISDAIIDDELAQESVIYRPQSLVIGIGLHWDTTKDTIREGIEYCLEKFNLSSKCIAKLVSIKKPEDVQGLIELGKEMKIPVEYVDREELSEIITPNPSSTVKAFEGTASVSEAAAIKVSCGELIVEKQKFPPNLTIAIARKVE